MRYPGVKRLYLLGSTRQLQPCHRYSASADHLNYESHTEHEGHHLSCVVFRTERRTKRFVDVPIVVGLSSLSPSAINVTLSDATSVSFSGFLNEYRSIHTRHQSRLVKLEVSYLREDAKASVGGTHEQT